MKKEPAHNYASTPFPDCASNCAAVEYLGCGECEDVCPWKFDNNGKEVDEKTLLDRLNIWEKTHAL